jgi:hypothetical protein
MSRTYWSVVRAARAAAEALISSCRSGGDSGTKSVQTQTEKKKLLAGRRDIVDAPSLGIAYLDLFLAQRDATDNMRASELVWFGIDLVLCF